MGSGLRGMMVVGEMAMLPERAWEMTRGMG